MNVALSLVLSIPLAHAAEPLPDLPPVSRDADQRFHLGSALALTGGTITAAGLIGGASWRVVPFEASLAGLILGPPVLISGHTLRMRAARELFPETSRVGSKIAFGGMVMGYTGIIMLTSMDLEDYAPTAIGLGAATTVVGVSTQAVLFARSDAQLHPDKSASMTWYVVPSRVGTPVVHASVRW